MSYTIKRVSEICHISPYTLRYYEKEGLLPPIQRDNNGNRLYTDDDLGMIQIIRCMKATGMTIAYIKNYIGLSSIQERRIIMTEQKQLIEEELKKYSELLETVNAKLDYYDEKIPKETLKKILDKKSKK
ncbi:MerR family transcriptional regulator [Metabacillus sp. GX 13764]|uniref:MerR family transcriptional regulator n=1 Tax=Metabacillus kandeliae TaxID=2900151 RepID=UPI001E5B2A7E|nr:MerR family transcriptional regulator [Metabacillus kandeliae]MCD7035117.1 MerR family transcriptional regulator [Metabacillus kandeliae]